ncbi:multidrug effflux MFS transporter [Achromobacter aegrifaciens]
MMVLMLGLLACVAPATIDAYLPAFAALEREFGVPQETVQLTLGVYMFCYAAMLLLHGTLSDSLGRRRIILAALGCYIGGSALAAAAPGFGWLLAARALQGLSAGAGIVVGQAIIRDCYEGSAAQRAMSYLIMVFNLSPALAPIVGGQLAAQLGWRSVFVMLAALAAAAWLLCAWRLPETLPVSRRRPLSWRALASGYGRVLGDRHFTLLAAAFSLIFAAQGFLIGAAPDFIANVLGLPETDFAYLFVPLVIGAMAGALFAARKAGRWTDQRITLLSYLLMGGSCLASVLYVAGAGQPALPWAVILPGVYTCGLAMCVPAMTLRILARAPGLSGTAASVLGFIQMFAFSIASGWGVPLIYGRPLGLALAMLACVAASAAGWAWLQRQSIPLANAGSG